MYHNNIVKCARLLWSHFSSELKDNYWLIETVTDVLGVSLKYVIFLGKIYDLTMIILRIVEIIHPKIRRHESRIHLYKYKAERKVFYKILNTSLVTKHIFRKKREEKFSRHTLGILQDVTLARCVCLVIERNILNTHNVATWKAIIYQYWIIQLFEQFIHPC